MLPQAAEHGRPLLVHAPRSAQAERLRRLAERVVGRLGETGGTAAEGA